MESVLETKGCSVSFGGLKALDKVDLAVQKGQILGLIGPNGAGKTTLFNIITGVYPPSSGDIFYDGRRINGLKPHQIARLGVVRTFQNIRLFRQLSALENVKTARHSGIQYSVPAALFRSHNFLVTEAEVEEESLELLRLMRLERFGHEIAQNLPPGEQRRLEIARALALYPKVLLLDEPTAGMNPRETQESMDLILRIRAERALSVLIIEHDMRVVMGISEKIVVLDYGLKIAEGPPAEVRSNPRVIKAYLGEE